MAEVAINVDEVASGGAWKAKAVAYGATAGTAVTSADTGYIADYDYRRDTIVVITSGTPTVTVAVKSGNAFGRTNALTGTPGTANYALFIPPGTLLPELFVHSGANKGQVRITASATVYINVIRGPIA